MNREDIESMLKIAVGIALIVLAVKFFVKLLPYIIVLFVLMLLYDSYKHYKAKKRSQKHEIPEAMKADDD